MYNKQNFINAVSNEFRILKHLAGKIPAGTLGYKPTEGQRTTLELLQYLSGSTVVSIKAILANDTTLFAALSERNKETTLENFSSVLDEREVEFKEVMDKFTDEELAKVINMHGQGEKTKGAYLIDSALRNLSAYKMQLFLYIKASGNTAINSSNLWGGIDTPAK
jgi:hypothetical protein